jgi:hypothetical protein
LGEPIGDSTGRALELDSERPVESLLEINRLVMAYYRAPRIRHAVAARTCTAAGTSAVASGRRVLRRRSASSDGLLRGGVDSSLFRADVAARDVYLLIAATGYFYQSNRYTLSAFLGEDLSQPEAVAHWEAFVKQSVLRTVLLDARSMTAS